MKTCSGFDGGPGMIEQLRELAEAEPFVPFTIRMQTGTRYHVKKRPTKFSLLTMAARKCLRGASENTVTLKTSLSAYSGESLTSMRSPKSFYERGQETGRP
jgi:hypothetical protein